jgi:hypothetical protein
MAGWSGVRVSAGTGNMSLPRPDRLWVPPPASSPVGTGGSFSGVKLPRCEADQSPASSAGVKNAWSYTSTPQ